MKLSAILAPLLDAKADHDLIRKQILAFEAEQADALEQRRKSDAERQARKRQREVASRDVTLRHSDRSLTGAGDAPVEDKPLKQQIEPPKKQNTAQGGVVAFKAKLSHLIDADLLDSFVAVRKTKRGALTGYAAGLFISDAEACGMSVSEAAKECVRSSWITVKPEYFQGKPRASPAQQQAPSQAEVFAIFARNAPDENQPEPQEDRRRLRQVISHLPTVRSG